MAKVEMRGSPILAIDSGLPRLPGSQFFSPTFPVYAQQRRRKGWLWLLSSRLLALRAKPRIQTDQECHPE